MEPYPEDEELRQRNARLCATLERKRGMTLMSAQQQTPATAEEGAAGASGEDPPATGQQTQEEAGVSYQAEEDVAQTEEEAAQNIQTQQSEPHSEEEGGDTSQTNASQAATTEGRRQPPFTQRELDILVPQAIDLIHFGTKNMGAGMRDCIWREITDLVNAVGPIVRTPQEVRRRWDDFKSCLKRKKAAHWNASRATGGGPLPESVEYTDLEELAMVCVSYQEVAGVSDMDTDTLAIECPHDLEAEEVKVVTPLVWVRKHHQPSPTLAPLPKPVSRRFLLRWRIMQT
ncbi:uncharacterized protein LOC134988132 [Pseudophryne corroboree]|uniref:uncharacterized protein LOC134988132 n=1 Tax=Pseudophryne corroboree TaxID=495146 RepID=UPI00308162BC